MSLIIAMIGLAGGIMFTPASDDLLVLTFLSYTSASAHSLILTWLILWLICSSSFAWFYGVGVGLNHLIPQRNRNTKMLGRAQSLIERHGHKMIFFSYFIPGLRHPVHYTAGFMRIPLKTYLLYSYSAAAFYASLWTSVIQFIDISDLVDFMDILSL